MDHRLAYFLIGAAVGFILGYIVKSLRELKEKVEEVDQHITHEGKKDAGYTTPDWLRTVAVGVVVFLVAYASFVSQISSNDVKDQADDISEQQVRTDRVVSCTQNYLGATLKAVNARTQFSAEQSAANLALQRAQGVFLGQLIKNGGPPTTLDVNSLNVYLKALSTYTAVVGKSSDQAKTNPYPTVDSFTNCLKSK